MGHGVRVMGHGLRLLCFGTIGEGCEGDAGEELFVVACSPSTAFRYYGDVFSVRPEPFDSAHPEPVEGDRRSGQAYRRGERGARGSTSSPRAETSLYCGMAH